jgi:hypothetical protein
VNFWSKINIIFDVISVHNRELYVTQVSMALIHDAVQLFAHALRRLDSPAVEIKPLDCESQDNWGHGASLINFMKDVTIITSRDFTNT